MNLPVEVFREAQDGGQDAVFISRDTKSRELPYTTTVQCKFSSDSRRTLKLGDLTREVDNVAELVQKGQAYQYLLMTSMSVSAPVAIAIKERLRELGVVRAHVFGKEYITRVIRGSGRLRALVPRVYGLGDLSIILDERRAAQTKALLGHIATTLKAYVPTGPHVQAVRVLSKHRIVMLVGNPATGKSTIAAVLSTIAADSPDHACYKADGPKQLIENWNPDEPGGFYWIDDAFGPNQLREDFVDHWISIMPKIQAAIATGNSFVLTSRRHIYEAARPKLGTRNHPLFRDGTAIVEVGSLTESERLQILYNHIKYGNQPTFWKSSVKGFLKDIAKQLTFTPEIARQLATVAYTANVSMTADSLIRFVRENREFLLQTVGELSKNHRAALTLVFLHRGRMPVGGSSPEIQETVIRFYEVSREQLSEALHELDESFLVQISEGLEQVWSFKHPTISDALAASLRSAEGMRELYVRGVSVTTILTEVRCASVEPIPDAVVVPRELESLLAKRLLETPDDGGALNRLLFHFLWVRASDHVFRSVLEADPSILARRAWASREIAQDPKANTYARAFSMGLLPADLRQDMGERIENDLFCELDTSFLSNEGVLALLLPVSLVKLAGRLKSQTIPAMIEKMETVSESPDSDLTPEENFEDIVVGLNYIKAFFDDQIDEFPDIDEISRSLSKNIDALEQKRREEEAQREEDDWRWREMSDRAVVQKVTTSRPGAPVGSRSIFSDVDE